MRLETPRLIIRSFEPSDAEALLAVLSDPEVRRYLPTSAPPSREQIEANIERRAELERDRGYVLWAVERRDTGEVVGQCGLNPIERTGPEIELAYHYGRAAWNHGYGTEAAIAVLAHALNRLGLERVIAICIPENVGSWRVMEKAGMRYEGLATYYGLAGLKKYVADRATWSVPA